MQLFTVNPMEFPNYKYNFICHLCDSCPTIEKIKMVTFKCNSFTKFIENKFFMMIYKFEVYKMLHDLFWIDCYLIRDFRNDFNLGDIVVVIRYNFNENFKRNAYQLSKHIQDV